MVGLLEFRQKLKAFYGNYSTYIIPCVRFFTVFLTLTTINSHIGYMARLDGMTIVLVMSLIGAFLPAGAATFFAAAFTLAHLFSLSMVAAGLAAAAFLLMFCAYYIFGTKDGVLLFLVPVLFVFRIPYLVPVVMGLIGTFFSVIPVSFGVLIYFMLHWVKDNASLMASSSSLSYLQQVSQMTSGVLKNQEMVVTIIAFAATLFVVYLFRRIAMKHSWEIAIGTGSLVNIMILLIGSSSLKLNMSLMPVLFGVLISAGLALVLEFFIFLVDYNSMIRTQFEDDEYYYYVKAVPKLSVAPKERKVTSIISPKKAMVAQMEEEEEMRRRKVIAQAQAEALRNTGEFRVNLQVAEYPLSRAGEEAGEANQKE
ncbi:MAG: hypothetical protein HFI93_02400 [Lachnospiraceae bacterium]|nr:hypothetical protein [Lachnospiraceae bacterium]